MTITCTNTDVRCSRYKIQTQGVTLVELIVTVSILSILATMAIPSFNMLVTNNRVASYANRFIGSLMLARSEAAIRGRRVVVCKSSDGANCVTTGNWAQGWIVFVDTDNDATVDSGEDILRVQSALASGFTLTGDTNVANYISYSSDGRGRLINGNTQNGTISLCTTGSQRAITLNAVGRAKINATGATCP